MIKHQGKIKFLENVWTKEVEEMKTEYRKEFKPKTRKEKQVPF